MANRKESSRRVLGIDLGANSLGWAIVLEENEEPTSLVAAGVRVCEAGVSSPKTVKMLSEAASRAQELGRRRFAPVDPPWQTFEADVRKAIELILVSYRVSRRVSGPLHEETNYSPPFRVMNEDRKLVEYRHVRKPLDLLSRDRLDAIVDPVIRQRVLDKLAELGEAEPKKAFKDPVNHPVTVARDGRRIPIHKVRIRENIAAISVGNETDGRTRHVSPGLNHHMEIVAVLGREGHGGCTRPGPCGT